jgi:hypothetical protein
MNIKQIRKELKELESQIEDHKDQLSKDELEEATTQIEGMKALAKAFGVRL